MEAYSEELEEEEEPPIDGANPPSLVMSALEWSTGTYSSSEFSSLRVRQYQWAFSVLSDAHHPLTDHCHTADPWIQLLNVLRLST